MAAMKSAVELAMEKLGKLQSEEPSAPLTDAQRQSISDLRKTYDAKIAEKEIMHQTELRKLMQQLSPHEAAARAQELQHNLQEAKTALRKELDDKIAAIRAGQ
jgi:Spy/CpxP family protein refolding chaperone